MVATDNGTHAGPRGRGARFSRCAALAALGLAALPAQAQEARGPRAKVRWVVPVKMPADRAPTVYGAAGKPLFLRFDVPVGAGAVHAPDVEVRRIRGDRNALILTPSRAASRDSVPVVVPLAGGPAKLTLVLRAEAPDEQVKVIHPGETGLLAQVQRRDLMATLAARPIVTLAGPNASVPDAMVQCRLNLLVRAPGTSQVASVELRTADRALCEASSTLSMRVGGDR
ncbi:MAG TPA: DUF2381 family protein [Myxococcaceae bacterium]|nr:DUF2381 family protein [Myxococcaceae bacterium]